jgi:hypothetical protein
MRAEITDHRHRRLLRAASERPYHGRAAEQRDELTTSHEICHLISPPEGYGRRGACPRQEGPSAVGGTQLLGEGFERQRHPRGAPMPKSCSRNGPRQHRADMMALLHPEPMVKALMREVERMTPIANAPRDKVFSCEAHRVPGS